MSHRTKETEETLARTVEAILDHLEESRAETTPVSDRLSPAELRDAMDLGLPDNGCTLADLVPVIRSYLRHSTRTASTKFLNQLFGGFDLPGVLGELVASSTNTSMYTYEVAPVATLMEDELVRRMRHLVGFEDGEGIFVTGGSNANMVAMLCARQHHDATTKTAGLGGAKLDAFVSEQAHYSFIVAANMLGIGTDSVVRVESDEAGRMIPDKLDEAIERSKIAGRTPFFVAATAGTTVLGAFDPITEIAAVARKHDIWFHIDGAWGAPVLLSQKHRHLANGSELADSFAWDAHKLMGVPLLCTAILLRHRGHLEASCSSFVGTEYIYHDNPEQSLDLGPMSLACGRKVDALKLWLAWKFHGVAGYEHRIDSLMSLAERTRNVIDEHPRLEMMAEPSYLNLCFRYVPEISMAAAQVDELNRRIRNRLADTGRALVNYAYIGERLTIRLVLPNPELNDDIVGGLLDDLVAIGHEMEAGSVDLAPSRDADEDSRRVVV